MKLPELTHLQFLVLSHLGSMPVKGRQVREALRKSGVRKTGPAFYQMMARMEEAKLVEGWYSQEVKDGQIIRERNYKILGNGFNAWQLSRSFYEEVPALGKERYAR